MRITHLVVPTQPWFAVVLLLCATVGCEWASEPSGAARIPGPPTAAPRSFELRGAPGPWWREGASDRHFEAESRACLADSREARRSAPEDARADAAYRAFLDCMERSGWRRGLRPPSAGLTASGR